jgi:hypothetical protein
MGYHTQRVALLTAPLIEVEFEAGALPRIANALTGISPWSSAPAISSSSFFFDSDTQGGGGLAINPTMTTAGSLSLSLGLVWWATRAGGLVSSLLITTPAWRTIDPLPVFLANSESTNEDADIGSGESAEAERMFDEPAQQEHEMPYIA